MSKKTMQRKDYVRVQVAKQKRFIETWTSLLEVLRNKEPQEAVSEAVLFIQAKVDTVQAKLDKNLQTLATVEEQSPPLPTV